MTPRALVAAEWGLVVLGVCPIAVGMAAFGTSSAMISNSRPLTATAEAPPQAHHLAASLLRGIVEVAPFRLSRAPAVAYQPGRPDLNADVSQPPKPMLTLSGVILGRHPAALIEGIPGRDGSTLLQLGDTVAGLKLRGVQSDRVVISGMDTTWTLKVREIWKQ